MDSLFWQVFQLGALFSGALWIGSFLVSDLREIRSLERQLFPMPNPRNLNRMLDRVRALQRKARRARSARAAEKLLTAAERLRGAYLKQATRGAR